MKAATIAIDKKVMNSNILDVGTCPDAIHLVMK